MGEKKIELSLKLRPKGAKTLVASPLRWAKDPWGEEDAKAAVGRWLVLGESTPKKRRKETGEGEKKKKKRKR